MYRAHDQIERREALERLEGAAEALGLGERASLQAKDLFLSLTASDRPSSPATMGACLYVAGLATGEHRSQAQIGAVLGVSRIAIQHHWRTALEEAGLEPPEW